jgi:hypothetical protein
MERYAVAAAVLPRLGVPEVNGLLDGRSYRIRRLPVYDNHNIYLPNAGQTVWQRA